jgi:hypothetical protein
VHGDLFLQDVFQENIIPYLIQIMRDSEFRVRKEASYAIFNAILGGSEAQIGYIEHAHAPLSCLIVCSDLMLLTGPWCNKGASNLSVTFSL